MPVDLQFHDEPQGSGVDIQYHDAGPAQPQGPGTLEALGRGALQGATLGFGDEIYGAGRALLDKIQGKHEELADLYAQHRDEVRRNNEAARAAHGTAYGIGEVGGGLAGMAIPGLGELAAGRGLASAAAGGAALGAASGLGHSDAASVEDQVRDATKGGIVGLAGGAAGYGVGKAIQAATPAVAGAAEGVGTIAGRQALRGGVNPLMPKTPLSPEAVRAAQDAGAFSGLKSVVGSHDVLEGALDQAGGDLGSHLQMLEQQGVRSGNIRELTGKWRAQADEIERNSIGSPVPDMLRSRAAELESKLPQAAISPHDDLVASLVNKGVKPERAEEIAVAQLGPRSPAAPTVDTLPIGQAEKIKSSAQDAGNYSRVEAQALDKARRQMASELRKANEQAILEQAGPEAAAQFQQLKTHWGNLEEARHAASLGAARLQNRGPIGIGALIVGHGNPVATIATHEAMLRGPAAVANLAFKSADKLTQLAATAPQKFGKYAGVFQRAASQGPQAVAAAHYVLSQTDPDYREQLKSVSEE